METALAVAAIVVTSLTLVYVVWSGQRQSKQLSAQIKALSDQTELLRRQLFGEVYEQAQIRDLQFLLPAKAKHPIAVFEDIQKENEEVILGKEVKVSKRWETELHVRFCLDAQQRLRHITWGFPDKEEQNEYFGHPKLLEYRRPFAVETVSQFERGIYKDWHGDWHMEFPFPRFMAKDDCFMVSFTVKGDKPGKFPLAFEVGTDEAKKPFREYLWVEVTD